MSIQRRITDYADVDLEHTLDRLAPNNSLYEEFMGCGVYDKIIVHAGTGEGKSRIALKMAIDSFSKNVELERCGEKAQYITLIAVPYVVIAEQFFSKLCTVRLKGERPLLAKMLTSSNVRGNSITLSWKKASQEKVTHMKYDTGASKGALIESNKGKCIDDVIFNDRYDSMKNFMCDVIVGSYEMLHALVMKKSDDILRGGKRVCVVFDELQEALSSQSKRFVNAFSLLHALVNRKNESRERTVLLTGCEDISKETLESSEYTRFLSDFHILKHRGLPKLISNRMIPTQGDNGSVSSVKYVMKLIGGDAVRKVLVNSVYCNGRWMMSVNGSIVDMDDSFVCCVDNVVRLLVDASTTFTSAALNIIRYWLNEIGVVGGDVGSEMIMINNKARAIDVDYILVVYVKVMLVWMGIKPLPRYNSSMLELTYIDDDDIRCRYNSADGCNGEDGVWRKYCEMRSGYLYNVNISKQIEAEHKYISGIVLGSENVTWRVRRCLNKRSNALSNTECVCKFLMPCMHVNMNNMKDEKFSKCGMYDVCVCDGEPAMVDTMESVRALAASMFIWHANADYDDEDKCERDFLMNRRAPPVIVATQKISVGADLPNISSVSVLMDSWDYDRGLIEQVIGRVDRERKGRCVCVEYNKCSSVGVLSQNNINHDIAMAMTNEFHSTALDILRDPSKHSESIFIDVLLDVLSPLTIPTSAKTDVVDVHVIIDGEYVVKSDMLPCAKLPTQRKYDGGAMKMMKLHEHEGIILTEVTPITATRYKHEFYNVSKFVGDYSILYGTAYACTQTIAHMASRLHMDSPNIMKIMTLGIIPEWPDDAFSGVRCVKDYVGDGIYSRFVFSGNDDDSVTYTILDRSDVRKGVRMHESVSNIIGDRTALTYTIYGACNVYDFCSMCEEMGKCVRMGSECIIVAAYLMFVLGFRVYKHQDASQLCDEMENIANYRKISNVSSEWLTENNIDMKALMSSLDRLAPVRVIEESVKSKCVRGRDDESKKVYERPATAKPTITTHNKLYSNMGDVSNVVNLYGAVRTLEVFKNMKLDDVKKMDTSIHREVKSSKLFYDLLDVVDAVTQWRDEMSHEGNDFHGKREDAQLFLSPPMRYMCGVCSVIKEKLVDRVPCTKSREENDRMREDIVKELGVMDVIDYVNRNGIKVSISAKSLQYMPFRVHPFFAKETYRPQAHEEVEEEKRPVVRIQHTDNMDGFE